MKINNTTEQIHSIDLKGRSLVLKPGINPTVSDADWEEANNHLMFAKKVEAGMLVVVVDEAPAAGTQAAPAAS